MKARTLEVLLVAGLGFLGAVAGSMLTPFVASAAESKHRWMDALSDFMAVASKGIQSKFNESSTGTLQGFRDAYAHTLVRIPEKLVVPFAAYARAVTLEADVGTVEAAVDHLRKHPEDCGLGSRDFVGPERAAEANKLVDDEIGRVPATVSRVSAGGSPEANAVLRYVQRRLGSRLRDAAAAIYGG